MSSVNHDPNFPGRFYGEYDSRTVWIGVAIFAFLIGALVLAATFNPNSTPMVMLETTGPTVPLGVPSP